MPVATRKLLAGLAAVVLLAGCPAPLVPKTTLADSPTAQGAYTVRGTVSFQPRYQTQATLGEVANAATVSLIDAVTGNTVSSSVTDASGSFVLTFTNFTPIDGKPYVLEAVKGLSVGGQPNRVGAGVVRIRTLLFWNGGWQSLTNSTPNSGISVSVYTTALAAAANLKQLDQAGLVALINKINPTTGGFTEAGGLTNATDFLPVVNLVSSAILLDQDPMAAISLASGDYSFANPRPMVTSVTPSSAIPGTNLTIKGAGFDPIDGRNTFMFGDVPAATWSVSADRTTATVAVPNNAVSGPFSLMVPGGDVITIATFLGVRGTTGKYPGSGEISIPYGMAMDSRGNLLVSEAQIGNRICKVTPDGTVTTLAGQKTAGYLDGAGGSAQFFSAMALSVGANDNLYVADTGNQRIRKVTPTGVVTTLAGDGTWGAADGPAASASFSMPQGILAVGDVVYVGDTFNHKIRKIENGVVSTFAGDAGQGFEDGPLATAKFSGVAGMCRDSAGNIYVCDALNHRIRKISSGGTVSTIAGDGTPGFVDGATSSARFFTPMSVALDPGGNLIVTDGNNCSIRKITPAGVVSTLAGNGTQGSADGPNADARFSAVAGLAVATDGKIFVTDLLNFAIRVVVP